MDSRKGEYFLEALSDSESAELLKLIAGVNREHELLLEMRLKPRGLPIEQYRILEALDRSDGLSMRELANEVFVDSTSLTKIIDRMMGNGDVYRAPDLHDRRKVLIFRSDKGAQRIKESREILSGSQSGMVNRLAPAEVGQLRALLKSLLKTTE
jgi:DNA-binding MarR family transcriptional regulator